jgi:hypothetical protein
VGSNPIARSSNVNGWQEMVLEAIVASQIVYNGKYGDVAKWQGKGLQNPHHGFKSHRRLSITYQSGLTADQTALEIKFQGGLIYLNPHLRLRKGYMRALPPPAEAYSCHR